MSTKMSGSQGVATASCSKGVKRKFGMLGIAVDHGTDDAPARERLRKIMQCVIALSVPIASGVFTTPASGDTNLVTVRTSTVIVEATCCELYGWHLGRGGCPASLAWDVSFATRCGSDVKLSWMQRNARVAHSLNGAAAQIMLEQNGLTLTSAPLSSWRHGD